MNEEILLELKCELEALITEREGMFILNMQRRDRGESMAYGEERFFELATQIKELGEKAIESSGKGCSSCRAMRNRLISIIKGTRSVGIKPSTFPIIELSDEYSKQSVVLTAIQEIAMGSHNWPEAMPYEPIRKDEITLKEKGEKNGWRDKP